MQSRPGVRTTLRTVQDRSRSRLTVPSLSPPLMRTCRCPKRRGTLRTTSRLRSAFGKQCLSRFRSIRDSAPAPESAPFGLALHATVITLGNVAAVTHSTSRTPRTRLAGFLPLTELAASRYATVPLESGAYVVVRPRAARRPFVERGGGGCWKGRDPTVPVERLEREWVYGAESVYSGKAPASASESACSSPSPAGSRSCTGATGSSGSLSAAKRCL